MKVKQIRRCGIFHTESACRTWLALTVGFIATFSVFGLSVFNLANTPTNRVVSQAALRKDLEGLKQELEEARRELNMQIDSSNTQHGMIEEKMLQLDRSLEEKLQELMAKGNESEPELYGSFGSSPEDDVQPTQAPVVVRLFENCTMEMLTQCTVGRSGLMQSTTSSKNLSVTFSRCDASYRRGSYVLDVPETYQLSNLFCSVQAIAGNLTFPVTSTFQDSGILNEEEETWTCLCHGYKLEGVEFTDFSCQMYGTFCPVELTAISTSPS